MRTEENCKNGKYFFTTLIIYCVIHKCLLFPVEMSSVDVADVFLPCFLPHRTLITGMASGSIVAFNIDFNRWHYEHQNRYWGGRLELDEGRSSATLPCLSNTKGGIHRYRDKGKFSFRPIGSIPLYWGCDCASGNGLLCAHVCNHRRIIRRYALKSASIIQHSDCNIGAESQWSRCRSSRDRSISLFLVRLNRHTYSSLFSLLFFFSCLISDVSELYLFIIWVNYKFKFFSCL